MTLPELINQTSPPDIWPALGGGPLKKEGGRYRASAFWRGSKDLNVTVGERGCRDFVTGQSHGILGTIGLALNCSRKEAAAWLAAYHGVTLDGHAPGAAIRRVPPPRPEPASPVDDTARIRYALRIWDECRPLPGTLGEKYLHSRGLSADGLEHAVRFHEDCPWGGHGVPAVVSLMLDAVTDEPVGVHRIGLTKQGRKLGPKMMLGRARGAVVKLSGDADVTMGLGVCEGIETGLAILQAGWAPVWSALSAGGVKSLPVLDGIEHLTILADHDPVGLQAAETCAQRWSEAGIKVTLRTPASVGADYIDAFRRCA